MNYYYGLGRRKSASAKVRLLNGKGQITINGQPSNLYLSDSKPLLAELEQPFKVANQVKKFDVSVKVRGGGLHGQVGAIRLGIAKALLQVDPQAKDSLRRADLLTRDPRAKERKKFGLKGARKKRQFTKR